jgi:hypothetical protein
MRDRERGAQFRPKGEQVFDEVVLIGIGQVERQGLAHEQFCSNRELTNLSKRSTQLLFIFFAFVLGRARQSQI